MYRLECFPRVRSCCVSNLYDSVTSLPTQEFNSLLSPYKVVTDLSVVDAMATAGKREVLEDCLLRLLFTCKVCVLQ